MSVFRTADERPIPARGWLALALYAVAIAIVAAAWSQCQPARAAGSEDTQTLTPGATKSLFCGREDTTALAPTYQQQGGAAVVICSRPDGTRAKEIHLRCTGGVIRLVGSGSDPGRGSFVRVACGSGGVS